MKLANALSQRAELQTRIHQLETRLYNNAQVQEGESPAEDPQDLLQELEEDYARLITLLSGPMIEKEQRRYPLPGGLTLEVNSVDPALETGFFYAEVEFSSEAQALVWKPGVLREYLDREVTGEKGQSMADYWAKTRGEG